MGKKPWKRNTFRFLLISIIAIIKQLLCPNGIVISISPLFSYFCLGNFYEIGILVPMFRNRNKTKNKRRIQRKANHPSSHSKCIRRKKDLGHRSVWLQSRGSSYQSHCPSHHLPPSLHRAAFHLLGDRSHLSHKLWFSRSTCIFRCPPYLSGLQGHPGEDVNGKIYPNKSWQ